MTSMSSPLPPVLTPKSKLGTPRSVKFDLPGRPSPTTELFENRLVSEQQFFTPKTVITPSPDVKQEIQNILNDVRSSESVYIAELRELQAYMNPYGNAHSVLESIKDVHRMIPDRMELLEDWVS